MYAAAAQRTLLEDWQARRKRLASEPARPEQFADLQIRILDYLIHRYHHSPEAARPARFSPKSDLYVNERAIVVHHHLWQGKVGGVKSRREAEARMSDILQRMAAGHAEDDAETPPDWLTQEEPSLVGQWAAQRDRAVVRRWRAIASALRRGRNPHGAIESALQATPFLPIEAIRYLHQRVADPGLKDRWALRLLVQCENRSAPHYGFLAWRERLEAGVRDKITYSLEVFFCRPDVHQSVAERIRGALANNHALVRLVAMEILGRVGTLHDIGLLSDLLSLPPQKDEHPDERAALTRAMQRIAEAE